MATYFHGGPEIQPDGLQTLYLMNPTYVGGYPNTATAAPAAHQTNMIFLNSPLSSLNPIPQQQHQQQQQQHFVGIPLQPTNEPNRPQPMQAATAAQYSLWSPRQHLSLSLQSPRQHQQQQQGLFGPYRAEQQQQQEMTAAAAASGSGDEVKASGVVGLQSVLMGSKYLKAAQQLLDEVVNVGKGNGVNETMTAAKGNDSSSKVKVGNGRDLDGGDRGSDGGGKKAADLSTAERQELQMKKAKLVNMLDEVEQRYRQYHQQMQMVVSSFEAVAGFGSARTYTALALQTISKQFRCLRDAISGQIRATSKSLGEEECPGSGGPGKSSVGSRLRFVDHHLRQQRALQQLGMIQHNAWRPQRGLPERAVSVLRAWLFEHFLHPYPKDSDKHMLAKQTGLTRSQVSNWFINARVRLWKPMVEEMYLEETKEQEQHNGKASNKSNNGEDKTSKSEASDQSASKSMSQQANSGTPSRTEHDDNLNDPKQPMPVFDSRDIDESSIMRQRLKKARGDESLVMQNQMGMGIKQQDELSNRELLMKFMDQGAGFGAYGPIGDIGRFNPHEQFAPRYGVMNGVSLTLGLPHCETLSLSGSQQPSYLSNESMQLGRRVELSPDEEDSNNYFRLLNNNNNNGSNASASHTPANAYESINIQSRKRFAAQLLPDFVA